MYDASVASEGLLRIGELSRRTGVKPDLLRAWERRYGLLEPERSAGGFRLYAPAAVDRIAAMQEHLAGGFSAAEAARLALENETPTKSASIEVLNAELTDALDEYDEPRAQAVFDRLLSAFSIDAVLRDAVLPFLHELGLRWERGEISVAQEHFASSVIRGRLLGLARGWGAGSGPVAVLACPPGEEHDLGLLALGIVLHDRGWRIAYLGPDTPMETLAGAAARVDARVIVLAAVSRRRFEAVAATLGHLAKTHQLAIAGAGASETLATRTGALHLTGGPVDEAQRLAAHRR
jgi:MerR family transcriptional regulator, light-induced transcriptional regulator